MDQIPQSSQRPDENLFFYDLDDLDPTPRKDCGFDQGYKKFKTNPSPSKEKSMFKSEKSTKDEPTPMQYERISDPGALVERIFKLSHFQQENIKDVKNKADECGLYSEIIGDEIQVVGEQANVFEFLTWLYNFLNVTLGGQRENFGQEELSLSTFHRLNKEDILAKAEDINIVCEFKYHTAVVTGQCRDLGLFKNYLAQVEMSTKNTLYPKYWDFEDTEMYSEIKVLPGCNEFEEVLAKMRHSLHDAEILNLTRIQNNYLISHYLTNLSMRQEVRSDSLNRKLLFHGTRDAEPHKIYRNFDTGFDLQYAKESGMFGKGLYFAQDAQYSHGYSYKPDAAQNRFKMILADVFLGKSYEGHAKRHIVKAPDGYDSVSSGHIHVIYNNFHSYPLYIIEYKTATPSKKNTTYIPQSLLAMPSAMPPAMPNYSPFHTSVQLPSLASMYGTFQRQPVQTNINTNVIPIPVRQPTGLSPAALKRVQTELIQLQKETDLQNFIINTPDEKDLSKLQVTCLGPESTCYEAGIFNIEIIFPHNYPSFPPKVTFKTPIYHPCIDKAGNICLGLLTNWSPTIAVEHVLFNLLALLHDPQIEEPLMPEIDFQYRNDKQGFVTQARTWTRTHAY